MAAHRTACGKVVKFGTLIEDSINNNHSKFGVCNSNSLAPPLEWMNEWSIYIALMRFIVYCCTPKALYNHVGGLSSTTTSVQHPLGWCDGSHRTTAPVRSPHTRYRWREERVIEPIKWMGIIRRRWLTRASHLSKVSLMLMLINFEP